MICPACGRDSDRIHCPDCGSYSTFGMAPDKDANGRLRKRLKCRKCGRRYTEGEPCNAPTYFPKQREKELRKIIENRPPGQRTYSITEIDKVMRNARAGMLARPPELDASVPPEAPEPPPDEQHQEPSGKAAKLDFAADGLDADQVAKLSKLF